MLHFRPPDIHVGGLIFYHGFFFLLSFFFRPLISELAERNSTISGHVVGSKCNLKMHVRNLHGVSLPPTNPGPKNHLFRGFRNFNGLYLRNETRYTYWASALQTTRGLLHRLETTWTLVYKRLQVGSEFSPTSVNSTFHFIATLRRRRSANGTQPNFAKRWTV